MRPLTQSDLVQSLLEAGQPHAVVEIKGELTTPADNEAGYLDVPVTMKVVGVRSALNKVVLEVEE